MRILHETHIPIERFPIPWSDSLPALLGPSTFQIEAASRNPVPFEWLGIVSSHNSRHGYASQDWQESLQSALHLARRQGWGVLCADATPYSDIIIHACTRFQIPFRVIQVCHGSDGDQQSERKSENLAHACNCGILWLLNAESNSKGDAQPHDLASVFLADHLFVLELREGGKIAKLLERRLGCLEIPIGSTYLSLPTNHASSSRGKSSGPKRIDWLARGAIGWLNTRTPALFYRPAVAGSTSREDGTPLQTSQRQTHHPIFPIRLLRNTKPQFLVHCTRSRRGPWPDQSVSQFHDELLQHPWSEQPNVLGTLQRILEKQRLIATKNFRRGKLETVCFSSNEITELLSMRRFQSHVARWDWEPYGIMIDRDWLESNGARQVTYIDRATAKQASEEELGFCQVISNESGSQDWRNEQEWRIAGDVRLSQVPFSKAIVFVPTMADARAIQSLSRWPIAIAMCQHLDT